jgi:hypothetical protein
MAPSIPSIPSGPSGPSGTAGATPMVPHSDTSALFLDERLTRMSLRQDGSWGFRCRAFFISGLVHRSNRIPRNFRSRGDIGEPVWLRPRASPHPASHANPPINSGKVSQGSRSRNATKIQGTTTARDTLRRGSRRTVTGRRHDPNRSRNHLPVPRPAPPSCVRSPAPFRSRE